MDSSSQGTLPKVVGFFAPLLVLGTLAFLALTYLFYNETWPLDPWPLGYLLLCFGTFWLLFGFGMWWRNSTARYDLDEQSLKSLISSTIEPQLKSYTTRLDEKTQWLAKRDDALDKFRRDYLDKSNQLMEGERKLAGAETSVMLKQGEMNELKGILGEKNDLAGELRRKLAGVRQGADLKSDQVAREKLRLPQNDARLTELERRASSAEKQHTQKSDSVTNMQKVVEQARTQAGKQLATAEVVLRDTEGKLRDLEEEIIRKGGGAALGLLGRDGSAAGVGGVGGGAAGAASAAGRDGADGAGATGAGAWADGARSSYEEIHLHVGVADRLHERLSNLNTALEEGQLDKEELGDAVRERTEAINFLKNRISATDTTVSAIDERTRALEIDIEEKAKGLARSQRELDQAFGITNELDNEIAALTAQGDSLQEAIDELEPKVVVAKQKQAALRDKLKKAEQTRLELERELRKNKAAIQQALDKLASLESKNGGSREELLVLERQLSEAEDEGRAAREALARSDARLTDLQREVAASEKLAEDERQSAKDAQIELKSRTQKATGLGKTLTQREATLTKEREGLARLERESEELAAKLIEVERKRSMMDQSMRDLEKKIHSLERSVSDKRSEISRLRTEATDKDNRIKEIQAKFSFVLGTVTERNGG